MRRVGGRIAICRGHVGPVWRVRGASVERRGADVEERGALVENVGLVLRVSGRCVCR